MPVSFSGLDLSWLNDPAKRLPPREVKPRPDYRNRAEGIAVPYFMDDIKPFVAQATRDPVEITSRSALRRYEIGNGIKQAGDLPVGHVVAENRKKWDEIRKQDNGSGQWTD